MTRSLLEKAMQDAVMSFQRLAEQLYEIRAGKPARRNAFQNLEAGSDLWKAETGLAWVDLVGADAIGLLRVFYQQRHLLAHQQGIVDSDYLGRSGDTAYRVGQRLVIRQDAVLEFAGLIERLGRVLLACEAPRSSAALPAQE